MKKTLIASLSVLTLSIMLLSGANANQIVATNQNYGSLTSSNTSEPLAALNSLEQAPKANGISDEHAKEIAKKLFGDDVVNHMIHRVKTPTVAQHPEARYTSIVNLPGSNWGGYIAQTSSVKAVQGNFKVDTAGGVAPWTGVGGKNGSGLAQTGIDDVYHEAWIEVLPSPPLYVFNVNNGDQIYSSVSHDDGDGTWNLLVQDYTTSTYYSDNYSYNPDTTTAEWVIERSPGSPNDLKHFTHAFTNGFWNDSSWTARNINASQVSTLYKVQIANSTQTLYPGSIGTDGRSFTISR